MSIKLGDIDVDIKIGSVDAKIYLGDTMIQSGDTPTYKCIMVDENDVTYQIPFTGDPSDTEYYWLTDDDTNDVKDEHIITAITINSAITYLRNSFVSCSQVNSIIIPDGVTSIGDGSFGDCSSLTEITIPSGVTSIGNSAFAGCAGLTGIICLATDPPMLGGYAFYYTNNCPIYVPSGSVTDYQTAWSDYASRIQAISN